MDTNVNPVAAVVVTEDNSLKEAVGIAKDYVGKKGIKAGLTQKQHTGILITAIEEVTGIEMTQDDKVKLFQVMYHLANGSALRQKLEKLKVLTPSTTTSGAIDPTAFL
jgi:hypothetical protein